MTILNVELWHLGYHETIGYIVNCVISMSDCSSCYVFTCFKVT